MKSNTPIDRQEASRLLSAIKFYLNRDTPSRKSFWYNLLKQLIQSTKREYLVPLHLKPQEWESLAS